MCTYCITPLAKRLCDTPLVLFTLKFHGLHHFLIYTPTPSVYAHPIFNCIIKFFGLICLCAICWIAMKTFLTFTQPKFNTVSVSYPDVLNQHCKNN